MDSNQDDHNVKYKVGSGYVIQTSERIEEVVAKMCWKTSVKVAKTLPKEATITQAETTAAVKELSVLWFTLDASLLTSTETWYWDENGKTNRNWMKDHTRKRHKRKI